MKNFTRILLAASLVLMVFSNAYSQDVFKTANVGIGTTTPQQRLDVAGSIKFSGALMPGGIAGLTGNILLSGGASPASPTWLPNGTSGTILVANSAGIPTWSSANAALLTTSNIVNAGASSAVVVTNGIGQVVGSGNVILDVQGTLNGILYGQGTGSSAIFTSAGTSAQVLEANSAGVPTWTTPSLTAGWALIGNSIAATNFLGTTDAQPLVFKVNGVNAGRIDITYPTGSNVNTYLGSGAGNGDGGILQVGIGTSALGGQVGTSSGGNSVMGAYAYPTATSGDWNVAIGAYSQYNASFVNANQGYNTGIGAYTLYSDNTGANSAVVGSFETAIGYQSMYGSGSATTYGNYNTALGTYSLYNIGSGGSNTALGANSLYNTTNAGRNVGVGDSALYSNTTGEYNTGLGYQSNVATGNLTNATAIGYQAVAPASNSITLGNSAVTSLYLPGYTSVGSLFYTAANTGQVAALAPGTAGTILASNGTSSVPTWISVAGINSVTGTAPIYINGATSAPNIYIQGLPNNSDAGGVLYSLGSGTSALFTPTPSTAGLTLQSKGTGAPTWAIPSAAATAWALVGNSIAATNFLGTTDAEPIIFKVNNNYAGRIDNSVSPANTYLGYGTGGNTGDQGIYEVGIGLYALGNQNTAGGANVAIGAYAYPNASAGDWNVAVGLYSMYGASFNNTTAGYNVAVGAFSMYSNSSGSSTNLGSYNTAVGYQSMYGTGTTSASVYNVALGYNSLYNISTGASNTALGTYSLYNTSAGKNTAAGDSSLYSNTTGEYNTGLGYQSNVSSGALTNATAIGYGAVAGESNSLVLGNGVAFVGINTSTPAQLLEIGGTANTMRVDALKTGGNYNNAITGNPGNIVYTNNANGDLYSLPNPGTINGQVLSLTTAGVPTWSNISSSSFTTYSITGNTGTSMVISGGNINSVVGSNNVTLDVQGTAGGLFYGNGIGTAAAFTSAGTTGQVLTSGGTGVPTWTTPSLTAGWALNGNSVAATNFLGTTDQQSLVFEVGGKPAGRIDYNWYSYSSSNNIANTYLGSWGVLGTTTYGSPGGPTGDAGTINVGIGVSALGGYNAGGNSGNGAGACCGADVAVGAFAYPSATSGDFNVAVGAYSELNAAFLSGTVGYTVGVGAYALYSNSQGQNETAVGYQSMYGSGSPTIYGINNTALGTYSLYNITTGGSNTALGSNALIATTAGRNTAAGDSSLYSNTTGEYNTGLGYQSNVGGGNLTNATAIGYQATAPVNNSIALGNTAVTSLYLPGYTSAGSIFYTAAASGQVAALAPGATGTILESQGTASAPAWVSVAGISNVSATAPIYITNPSSPTTPNIGIQGLPNNSDQWGVLYSLGSGTSALFTPTPSAAGLTLQSNGTAAPTWANPTVSANAWALTGNSISAGQFLGTTDVQDLVFEVNGKQGGRIDYNQALNSIGNTYLGSWGVLGTTTYGSPGGPTGDAGTINVGIGLSALGGYDQGGNAPGSAGCCGANVAVGAFAFPTSTNGDFDVAIGAYSMLNANFVSSSVGWCVGIGAYSLYSDFQGYQETAIGYQSMYGSGTPTTYGISNTAIGTYSLYNIGTGGSNTALGTYSLYNTTNAGRNTAAGDSSLYSNITGEYNTGLGYQSNVGAGNLTNATAIGYQAVAGASNTLVLGNGAAFVGINTSAPAQLLEVGGTANTVRVDALKSGATYNQQISANPGNIVYSNNTNGDLYSLPNGTTGTVLTLNASGVPTWASPNAALTTYSITGNTGTSVVISGGNLNSVVGSGNVTLDVQSTTAGTGGIFYGNGLGTAAAFNTTGSTGQVLLSGGLSAPTWGSANSALTTNSIVNGGANSPVVVNNGANQVVGGTNVSVDVQGTLNGVLYGQGSGSSALFTSAGTSGQVLAANTSGVPTWTTPSLTAGWALNGNSGTTPGTNYIGTTDGSGNHPLQFEVNGVNAGSVDGTPVSSLGNGNTYFGLGSGNNDIGNWNVGIGLEALSSTASANAGANVAVGVYSLAALQEGSWSVGIGAYAGRYTTFATPTPAADVAIGSYSLYSNTSGQGITTLGYYSMYGSGSPTAVGFYNTALGYQALYTTGGGGSNTAIGSNSLYKTTGGKNTAVGDSALVSNTVGTYNTALGYDADVSTNNLSNATAIGYLASAPANNSITLGNSAVTSLYLPGYNSTGSLLYTAAASGQVAALIPGSTGTILESQGSSSVPIWASVAGINSVSGTPPIYVNTNSPYSVNTPNVYIQGLPNNSDAGGVLYSLGSGSSALFTSTPASANLVLTSSAAGAAPTWTTAAAASGAWSVSGNSISATYGANFLGTTNDEPLEFYSNNAYAGAIDPINANVYFGGGAGGDNSSLIASPDNVAIGWNALTMPVSTSEGVVAVGANALYNYHGTQPGNFDGPAGIGAYALYSLTTGFPNEALGSGSGYSLTTGTFNVAVGFDAGYYNQTGTINVAVGDSAMFGGTGSAYTGATANTAVGVSALSALNNGASYNTAVGYEAGRHITTGTGNVSVGYQAGYGNTSGNNNTVVGYSANVASGSLSNATAIGANAYASASNTLILGAIQGVNGYSGSNPIVNVGIGTNAPDVDAALAIKTGHLETQVSATGATAIIATGTNVASQALTGTDVGGVVTFSVTGAGSTGTQVQVNFVNPYAAGSIPTVLITPANLATAAIMSSLQPYVSATSPLSNTGFVINFAVAPSTGGPYSFNYFVIETQ